MPASIPCSAMFSACRPVRSWNSAPPLSSPDPRSIVFFVPHHRKLILQDVKPEDVLVTPTWEALLRPNYDHASEGEAWKRPSIYRVSLSPKFRERKQHQQQQCSMRPSRGSHSEVLMTHFSNATCPDYQVCVSGKKQRLIDQRFAMGGTGAEIVAP